MRRSAKHDDEQDPHPHAELAYNKSGTMAYVWPRQDDGAYASQIATQIGTGDNKTGELVTQVVRNRSVYVVHVFPRMVISPEVLKAYLKSRLASLYFEPSTKGRHAERSLKLREDALR